MIVQKSVDADPISASGRPSMLVRWRVVLYLALLLLALALVKIAPEARTPVPIERAHPAASAR